MASQEPSNPSRLMDELHQEPPYEGDPGRTHTDMIHFTCPCGAIFPLSVLRSVNVATDRDLAEAAVAGKINQANCPQCHRQAVQELPYALHHPHEERFILVIPERQRHLELAERAKLLKELSEASAVPIPTYVLEFQVVFGTDGLRNSLSRPPKHVVVREELTAKQHELDERERHLNEVERLQTMRENQLSEKELAVEKQEESVTAREDRLKERGEHVTSMEDELRQRAAEHQANVESLTLQRQMLDRREIELGGREQDVEERATQLRDWEERLIAREQALEAAQRAAEESARTQIASHPLPGSALSEPFQSDEEKISTGLYSMREEGAGATPEQTQRRRSLSSSMAEGMVDDAEELTDDDLVEAEEILADDLIEGEAEILPSGEPAQGPAEPHPGADHAQLGGMSDLMGPQVQETYIPLGPAAAEESSAPPAESSPAPVSHGTSPSPEPAPAPAASPSPSAPVAEPAARSPQPSAFVPQEPRPPETGEPPAAGSLASEPAPSSPEPSSPIEAPSSPAPAPSISSPSPSGSVQAPAGPAPAPTGPVQTPAGPAPAPSGPVQTPAGPAPAPSEPAGPPSGSAPAPLSQPAPAKLAPQPPAEWVKSKSQTWYMVDGTDVNLLARVDEDTAEAILGEKSDLWVQLHLLPTYPMITLTLVLDPGADELEAVHWLIDIEEDIARNLLQLLRRRFRAHVQLYDETYALIDEVTFEPPREVNVAHVVDRATQELGEIGPAQLSPVQAREKFFGDWDWAGKKKHPFTEDAYAEIGSPSEAKLALGILSYWTEPQNHEYLVLVKSVPVDLLDTITRRILDGAIKFGLWLPPPLRDRAVALALATDVPSLMARLIDGAASLGPEPEGIELGEAAENWQRLLHDAEELDLPVNKDTLRMAEGIIERASASGEQEEVEEEPEDVGPLEELDDQELLSLLERRSLRTEAALELAKWSNTEHLEALFRAARKMSRADLIRLVPPLLAFGEPAGDYFVEGLTSRKSFTRHACALALGELKLRRAVVPLLHQMMSEKTPVWSEIARALGQYGASGIKPLQRYLRDPRGQEERLVRAMAFFALHGATKQIENLASGDEPGVATLARQALDSRDVARTTEDQIKGEQPIEGQAPLIRFSRRLHLALTGGEQPDEEELLEELGDSDILELDEDDD